MSITKKTNIDGSVSYFSDETCSESYIGELTDDQKNSAKECIPPTGGRRRSKKSKKSKKAKKTKKSRKGRKSRKARKH
jgi:hypothetical protein